MSSQEWGRGSGRGSPAKGDDSSVHHLSTESLLEIIIYAPSTLHD